MYILATVLPAVITLVLVDENHEHVVDKKVNSIHSN